MYRSYNGEELWEGEGHGKEEDMESAYMTICLRFLGRDGGVVVRFSLSHVGISRVF